MDAAEAAGLLPLKVNVVLISGVNDDEVPSILPSSLVGYRRTVRFIEFMRSTPLGAGDVTRWVPSEDVLARINDRWPIEAITPTYGDPAPGRPLPVLRRRRRGRRGGPA